MSEPKQPKQAQPKQESPEIIGLRANVASFAASVKAMEANPDRSETVLASERDNLAHVSRLLDKALKK